MNRPRVVIADDHAVFAEGLRRLLDPDFNTVRVVHDGAALVPACVELAPDLVVADVSMPGLSGIEAARRVMAARPRTKVVLLTMHTEVEYALAALDEGVAGYLLKTATPDELIGALRQALAGSVYVSPAINAAVQRARRAAQACGQPPRGPLSDPQRQVLRLLAAGRSAKEIGVALNLSPKTIEYHKYRMMQQLRITSSAGLVQYAVRTGIAADSPPEVHP